MADIHENTYTVRGMRGDRAVTLVHTGTDHTAAYDAAVAYARHPDRGVSEVVMFRQNHWGEVSVSGRWGVRTVPARPEPVHTCGPGITYGCDVPDCDGDNGD